MVYVAYKPFPLLHSTVCIILYVYNIYVDVIYVSTSVPVHKLKEKISLDDFKPKIISSGLNRQGGRLFTMKHKLHYTLLSSYPLILIAQEG